MSLTVCAAYVHAGLWEVLCRRTGRQGVTKRRPSRNRLERRAIEGDSPVGERSGRILIHGWGSEAVGSLLPAVCPLGTFPSSAGHVEPGVNPGGPPPKAKYSLTTDSVKVARVKGEKHAC